MEFNQTLEFGNYSSTSFPEVSQGLLNEWIGETYPAGSWYVDECNFDGLEALTATLEKAKRATFTVACFGSFDFVIRESNRTGKIAHHSASYPERLDGARGPVSRGNREGELFALKSFVVSRAKIGEASTFEVIRTEGLTTFTLID